MIDAYLQIEGIKGESADAKHKDWIEVTNVTWSVNVPRAASVSTAGGQTSGKAALSELTFQKLADLCSPSLLQTCAMGKTIPKVKFAFRRVDGHGVPICYDTIELENVMLSGVTPNSGDVGTITGHVNLAYSKIKWTSTQQKIAGGIGGNTAGGWDAAANKVV